MLGWVYTGKKDIIAVYNNGHGRCPSPGKGDSCRGQPEYIDHIPVSDHALCHIFSFSDDLHAADFKKSYIGGGDGAHFTYDHDSSDEASGKAAVIGCG